MSATTSIAWTDHTFNPWWGCQKVSPGCANCYAEGVAKHRSELVLWGPGSTRRIQSSRYWGEPKRWDTRARRKGRKTLVFCGSMCDVFDNHPSCEGERTLLWPLIRETPNLIWQLLTKRPENIARMLPDDWGKGYPNVWLGVSIEDADYAGRFEWLHRIDCALRFVSYEPALSALARFLPCWQDVGWVIAGGESGPRFRFMALEWVREMRDKCRDYGIPFFYKQSPGLRPGMDPYLDGELIQEFPEQAVRNAAKE